MANNLGIAEDCIFEEKQSGKNTNRKELQRLLATLEENDELYIESFSRLSRSLSDLLSLCELLNEKGVTLVSLKEGECDTRTASGRLMISLMGVLAQYEREIRAERVEEGRKAKIEREGRCGGRKAVDESKLETAFELYRTSDKSVSEICAIVGFTRATFYKYAKERGVTRD